MLSRAFEKIKPHFICLHPSCIAFFPTSDLLDGHVKSHFGSPGHHFGQYPLSPNTLNSASAYATETRPHVPILSTHLTGPSVNTDLASTPGNAPANLPEQQAVVSSDSGRLTCSECGPEGPTFSRGADLLRHTDKHRREKQFPCTFTGCKYSGLESGFYRKDKLAAHVKSRHSGQRGH